MGKFTLLISTILLVFVGVALYFKASNPSSPVTTSYKPSPSPVVSQIPTPEEKSLPLTITSPTETTVSTQLVTISGRTAPFADVFIHEIQLKADSTGVFSTSITLDQGENTIVITANDDKGNYAEKEITVSYMDMLQ